MYYFFDAVVKVNGIQRQMTAHSAAIVCLLMLVISPMLFVHCTARLLPSTFFAMPWMCLERCGFNATQIHEQVAELRSADDVIKAVSFEWADLGDNGTLIVDSFTNVAASIYPFAVSVPMITTVELKWIRSLFDHSTAVRFASNIVQAAKTYGNVDGVNFDFEPNDDSPTQNDAIGYSEFLGVARRVLWEEGNLFVSVDVAEWSAIWNWTLINTALTAPLTSQRNGEAIPAGYIMSMSTYATSDALFLERLDAAMQNISASSLVVGLDVWHSNRTLMNESSVAWRFGALAAKSVCQVAIWQTPMPKSWLEGLRELSAFCPAA